MTNDNGFRLTRREMIKTTGIFGVGLGMNGCHLSQSSDKLLTRQLGQTGFEVTTMGLGGQGSLQWTPAGVVPEKIIIKAMEMGINYFDTSNVYGPSQLTYGKAFRTLHLIPGRAGYDEKKRRSIFLASKTLLRAGKGTVPDGLNSWTHGPDGSLAIDDLKRTLTQVFGDGKGYYPKGSYVDVFQLHDVKAKEEITALRIGLDNPDPNADFIGTLAALRDYRDGTNRTGLNPKEERLIRHIGLSGHNSAPALMEMIQLDTENLLETILLTINPNDRFYLNMQYNALPVAAEKGMGVISMKVFADGAMYTKPSRWTEGPDDVVTSIGSPSLSSEALIQYSVSTPGVSTTIMGIGHIDNDPAKCQLYQNLAASQIRSGALSNAQRRAIEQQTSRVKNGKTNWFQAEYRDLTAPNRALLTQTVKGKKREVKLTWNNSYAGDAPISHYEIIRDGQKIDQVAFKPQISRKPLVYDDSVTGTNGHEYELICVDHMGRKAKTQKLVAESVG